MPYGFCGIIPIAPTPTFARMRPVSELFGQAHRTERDHLTPPIGGGWNPQAFQDWRFPPFHSPLPPAHFSRCGCWGQEGGFRGAACTLLFSKIICSGLIILFPCYQTLFLENSVLHRLSSSGIFKWFSGCPRAAKKTA